MGRNSFDSFAHFNYFLYNNSGFGQKPKLYSGVSMHWFQQFRVIKVAKCNMSKRLAWNLWFLAIEIRNYNQTIIKWIKLEDMNKNILRLNKNLLMNNHFTKKSVAKRTSLKKPSSFEWLYMRKRIIMMMMMKDTLTTIQKMQLFPTKRVSTK